MVRRGYRGAGRVRRRGSGRVSIPRSRLTPMQSSGSKFRPPADPPSLVVSPWNNIVAELGFTAAQAPSPAPYLLTSEKIGEAIKDQVALLPTVTLEMRIFDIRVWNVSGGGVTLQVLDLQNVGAAAVYERTLFDFPGRNHWARVGWRWSVADRSDVKLETQEVVARIKVASQEKAIVYVGVVWRPTATVTREETQSLPVEGRVKAHDLSDPVVTALRELSEELTEIVIIK